MVRERSRFVAPLRYGALRYGALALVAVLSGAPGAFAQNDRADIRYETVTPQSIGLAVTYGLGVRLDVLEDGSMIVAGRDEFAANRELRSVEDPQLVRRLRRGDVITHVDGVRLDSIEAYDRAMQSSGGRPRLRVVESETGETADWLTDSVRQLRPGISSMPADLRPTDSGVVRAVLIAPTDDGSIGDMAEKTIARVRKVLEASLPPDRLEVVAITGSACDARGVLRQIEQMLCRQRDTLFVYVAARSGIDPRYAIEIDRPQIDGVPLSDGAFPDDGQFFRLRDGDLLRRSLWERMTLREARLTVLVADTAFDAALLTAAEANAIEATPADETRPYEEASPGSHDGWARRLLAATGSIDVRVASAGQSGWFDPLRGGWYTEALFAAAEALDREDRGDWEALLETTRSEANDRYVERRKKLLGLGDGLSATARARLKAQPLTDPKVRTHDLRADETLDHLPSQAD